MAVWKEHAAAATGKTDLGLMSSECLLLRELLVSSLEAHIFWPKIACDMDKIVVTTLCMQLYFGD